MFNAWSLLQARIKAIIQRFRGRKKVAPQEASDQRIIAQLSPRVVPNWTQLKQLNKVLAGSERQRLLLVTAIFFVAVITLLIRGYFAVTVEKPAYGGTYTEGLIGTVRFVNPLLAPNNDVDRDISQLVFSGLMKVNAAGNLEPDLAASYTVSADQKTYIFVLRDNLRWHDNEMLTAQDVVFTFNTILDPEFKSPLRVSFSGVTVEALSDTEIRFQLSEPYPPFLASLTVGIIPNHVWYGIPSASATLAEPMTKPIGSGPYAFDSLTKDSKSGEIKKYSLKANNNYYGKKAYIQNIIFKMYPDFTSGVEALKNKNVDGLSLLPKDPDLKISSAIKLHNPIVPQYTAVFFNPNNNEVLKDRSLRQALAYAIDRQNIVDTELKGQGQVINSPILPTMIGYDAELTGYVFDQTKAKELLDQAGWKIPEGGAIRTKDGAKAEEGKPAPEELSVVLTAIDQADNIAVANILAKAWQDIGIKTEVQISAKNKIRKDVIEPRNYQLLLFSQVIDNQSGVYPFWHSSQNRNPGLNLSVLANKDIDAALEKIRAAGDPTTELNQFKIFQTKLSGEAFAIFLYNPSYTYPVSTKVHGLETLTHITIPAERFSDVTNWYIATKRSWK